jgi:hypothetical protein
MTGKSPVVQVLTELKGHNLLEDRSFFYYCRRFSDTSDGECRVCAFRSGYRAGSF